MDSANESRRYYVTSSLIGGNHTQNDPYIVGSVRYVIIQGPICVMTSCNRHAVDVGNEAMVFISLHIDSLDLYHLQFCSGTNRQ